MHYYNRNIGDYHKKAGKLSMLEHGAYTLLLDACYDRETFPTLDDAIEWTWAESQEEIEAVKRILAKFFKPHNGVYVQNRVFEVLEDYHIKCNKNKNIALEREEAKRTKRARNVNETCTNEHERAPNQEPITNNQEPIKKTGRFAPPSLDDVREYIQARGSPVNPEAFVDFYTSNGWKVGKNVMKDWQACVRTWEKRNETNRPNNQTDTRSRAKRVSDELDEIARKDIAKNGFTTHLD